MSSRGWNALVIRTHLSAWVAVTSGVQRFCGTRGRGSVALQLVRCHQGGLWQRKDAEPPTPSAAQETLWLSSALSLPLVASWGHMSRFSQLLALPANEFRNLGSNLRCALHFFFSSVFHGTFFSLFSSPSPLLTIHSLNRKLKERLWECHKK